MGDKARVTLDEGLQAKIDIRDFTFTSDEKAENGGTDTGPEPPEMLLASLGACAVITMKLYAQRKGWDLRHVEVEVEIEKADPAEYPDVSKGASFLNIIHKRYTFAGDLDDEQKTRLMEIASKCPVARVVANPVIYRDSVV
jgi:putative redox protein